MALFARKITEQADPNQLYRQLFELRERVVESAGNQSIDLVIEGKERLLEKREFAEADR
ncbi:hypothetical protein [Pajaroellobacter abortibovis]|uniref:hypothetical protein n=1 Tax=Pajaroellobacter abortibovis TaxID=1882918 RepID=UPI0012EC5CB9|nr:hypothetical protein [Pajaroellobacter abortibovis]